MFTLGFIRQYRAILPPKHDLASRRLVFSALNGLYYASPMGVVKLIHAVDRIEIFIKNTPRERHDDCYEELIGKNNDTF